MLIYDIVPPQKQKRKIKKNLFRKVLPIFLTLLLIFQIIGGALLPFNLNLKPPSISLQSAKAAGESWLSGWAYRKPISIQNSTSTLTDYQVKIELTPSNFDYSKASSTLADLRFTGSDGTTTIPYWIETASTTAISTIWVKVPSLAGNSTSTIYIYYGNPSASSASNGTNTFLFFDDFSDGDYTNNPTWTVGAGTFSVQEETLSGQTSKRLYSASQGVTITSPSTLAQNGCWEWNFYNQGRDGYGNALQQGQNYIIYVDANNYVLGYSYSGYAFRVRVAGVNVLDYDSGSNTIATGIIKYKITRVGDTWTFYADGVQKYQGTASGVTSTAITKYITSASGGESASYPNRVDNFRYRKYASPEPTISSMGSEEVNKEILTKMIEILKKLIQLYTQLIQTLKG